MGLVDFFKVCRVDWRLKASARRQWDGKLIRLQDMCETAFADSTYIEKMMLENGIIKSDLRKWMYFNQKRYNEKIQNSPGMNIEMLRASNQKSPVQANEHAV